jgi:ribosomal protein L11 methyltransferase
LKSYPALDIRSNELDAVYAALDDCSPTAIEELPDGLRAFFSAIESRDRAMAALSGQFDVSPLDVSDEDWARRSQENLQPITVDRITVVPRAGPPADASPITIVIQPSMGFGTGHHATTRLCLSAMQAFDVSGKTFLDIGTGSGVLAIAAARLGAVTSRGIDVDPDAIQSARENVTRNPDASHVSFDEADLANARLPPFDIVAANLTGALLIRSASAILGATVPGGLIILSGLMRHERDDVRRAFGAASVEWERFEDEWVGLVVKKP